MASADRQAVAIGGSFIVERRCLTRLQAGRKQGERRGVEVWRAGDTYKMVASVRPGKPWGPRRCDKAFKEVYGNRKVSGLEDWEGLRRATLPSPLYAPLRRRATSVGVARGFGSLRAESDASASQAMTESATFVHGPIPLFLIALKGIESGYRHCFRSLYLSSPIPGLSNGGPGRWCGWGMKSVLW
jgi:hypothetical protein